jgi:restriction system protein
MAIPDYQSIMLPLLRFAADGKEHSLRETIEALADHLELTDAERRVLLPSGRQPTFDNRVGWARTYITKAGLLESTRRGHYRITQRGLEVLERNPPAIRTSFLRQFPEFVEFQTSRRDTEDKEAVEDTDEPETPEEGIEAAYQAMRQALAVELLQTIMKSPPSFFERLVIDLLVRMGYGGTRKDAGQAIGKSGDGGIDGIIKEDRLGLDVVYVQAKRWDGNVGRPEIQKFAGALQGQRAMKGVFITTSSFTQAAQDYVSRIGSKIVLIDGNMLTELMIDHNIGVTPVASYEIKQIDSDYFES